MMLQRYSYCCLIVAQALISFQFAKLCFTSSVLEWSHFLVSLILRPAMTLISHYDFCSFFMLLLLFFPIHGDKSSASICFKVFSTSDREHYQLQNDGGIEVQGFNNLHMPGLLKIKSSDCKLIYILLKV